MKIRHPYIILALLTLAYTLSFMDRYAMNLLLNDVKRDLHLTEMQAGLLAGAGFAVLYALMTVPMGLLADRKNRITLATIGLTIWSVMTIFCGLAKNFGLLIIGRTGVGFGEAALTPAAYPVIKSLFKPKQLATALGIYSCGIYLGSGLAYWLGGKVMAISQAGLRANYFSFVDFDWQVVFIVFGLPGLLLAVLLLFVRIEKDEVADKKSYSFTELKQFLFLNNYRFLKFALASSLFNVAVYAVGVWLPAYLQRAHNLTTAQSGELLGIVMLVVAPLGAIAGGTLGDKFGNATGTNRLKAIMYSILLAAICFALVCINLTGAVKYLPFVALCFALSMPVAITAATVQEMAPANMRSIAPAILLMFQNLIGMSLGPVLVAVLTQYVFCNDASVGKSIGLVGVVFCMLSVLVFNTCKTSSHE